jgi:hypothetical protein
MFSGDERISSILMMSLNWSSCRMIWSGPNAKTKNFLNEFRR